MSESSVPLFRFSLLRGAESRGVLQPVAVVSQGDQPNDRLMSRASAAATWLRERDLPRVTVADFAVHGLGIQPADPPWTREEAAGLVSLAGRQMDAALRGVVARDSGSGETLVMPAELVTVSALMAAIGESDPTATIAEWIERHPLVFPTPAAKWLPHQALVRAPGIIDHYVVREELLGYRTGEIEDIKNYLRGERKTHGIRFLKVTEEEVLTENESETTRTEEVATQRRSTLSATAQDTANQTIGLDAAVQTEGQYGPTKVSTDFGFQYSSTTSQSRQSAAEMSTDVMERSVSVERERELRRITRRSRQELEEKQEHAVDNVDKPDHLIGIYQWVDSVWRATTYYVGKRLLLEFLVPQPGSSLLANDTQSDLPPAPDALPADLFTTLTAQSAAELAVKYGADGVVAPPLETQVIGVPFGSAQFKDEPPERVDAVIVKEVKVPDGYVGESVFVVATAMGRVDTSAKSNIVVDVPGARPEHFLEDPAAGPNPFMVPAAGAPAPLGRPNADLYTFVLQTKTNFGPGATVPVTIYTEDMRGVAGTIEVHCRASREAMDQWRLDTVQALSTAYRARLTEWEAHQAVRAFESTAMPTPDVRALCRHACIGALLGTWPSTTDYFDTENWPKPGALANASGALISFLEQTLEWNNLQYVAYPYYWAERSRWHDLLATDHPDPQAREFLRAGAVRMVVPVSLAHSEAVLFYLATGVPWGGGNAPIPGQKGYLAIAEEIRLSRLGEDPTDVPVNEYEYTLPTSLTILRPGPDLPDPTE